MASKTKGVRCWVVDDGVTIAPFGDAVGELWLGEATLDAHRRTAVAGAGLGPPERCAPGTTIEGPAVVMAASAFASRRALEALVRGAPPGAVAALARPADLVHLPELQDLRPVGGHGAALAYDVFFVPAGVRCEGSLEALRAAGAAVLVRGRTRSVAWRPAVPFEARRRSAPQALQATDAVVMHVRHWVHVLRLNLALLGLRWLERARRRPLRTLWWLLRAWHPRARMWRHRFRARLVEVGPGCDIHPSARIEGSILGRNVKVGAGCEIRHSYIGDGCVLGDHTRLTGCSLGPEVTTLNDTGLVGCAAFPGATLASQKAQLSLFGRDAFVTSTAWFLDARFDGDVRVETASGFLSLGTAYLGGCVGHRARLGAGVLVAPGRAIPNDYVLVAEPAGVLSEPTPGLAGAGPLVVRGGRLEPLGGGAAAGASATAEAAARGGGSGGRTDGGVIG